METFFEKYFIIDNPQIFIVTCVTVILIICICFGLGIYELKKK